MKAIRASVVDTECLHLTEAVTAFRSAEAVEASRGAAMPICGMNTAVSKLPGLRGATLLMSM
jgi:hypothetical protein